MLSWNQCPVNRAQQTITVCPGFFAPPKQWRSAFRKLALLEFLTVIPETSWKPQPVSDSEIVVLHRAAQDGEIDIGDPDFGKWAQSERLDPYTLVRGLVVKGWLAWSSLKIQKARLITSEPFVTAIFPTGETIVTDNAELFGLWMPTALKKATPSKKAGRHKQIKPSEKAAARKKVKPPEKSKSSSRAKSSGKTRASK
jgi:hypothetical protein